MRIVCLSDSHNQLHKVKVPEGDVLVHAGDATNMGTVQELARFYADLAALPHKRKVVIAGNHERLFDRDPGLARSLVPKDVDYLQDSGVVIDGVKFWGSPWTPAYSSGWAFQLGGLADSERVWGLIPDGTDVLVTHGPPHRILDEVPVMLGSLWEEREDARKFSRFTGCPWLLDRVLRVKPKLHVFGHIHSARGEKFFEGTHFVNAAICDEGYVPNGEPVVHDL